MISQKNQSKNQSLNFLLVVGKIIGAGLFGYIFAMSIPIAWPFYLKVLMAGIGGQLGVLAIEYLNNKLFGIE